MKLELKMVRNSYVDFVLTISITVNSMFLPYKELNFAQNMCLVRISYKTNVILVSLNSNGRLGYVTETVCFH